MVGERGCVVGKSAGVWWGKVRVWLEGERKEHGPSVTGFWLVLGGGQVVETGEAYVEGWNNRG